MYFILLCELKTLNVPWVQWQGLIVVYGGKNALIFNILNLEWPKIMHNMLIMLYPFRYQPSKSYIILSFVRNYAFEIYQFVIAKLVNIHGGICQLY